MDTKTDRGYHFSLQASEPTPACLDGAWVAVQVRPQHENFVTNQLRSYGYECFLPKYRDQSKPAIKTRLPPERALFPGYVFCRYQVNHRMRIVSVGSVTRIVGFTGRPETVSEEEIDAVRRIVDSGLYSEPWRFIQAGERVQICTGPLAGLQGILTTTSNSFRFIVSVALMQRSVAVEVSPECILPVSWPRVPAALMLGRIQ